MHNGAYNETLDLKRAMRTGTRRKRYLCRSDSVGEIRDHQNATACKKIIEEVVKYFHIPKNYDFL